MTKIVYNACYGGFSLSDEAVELYLKYCDYEYTKKFTNWNSSVYRVKINEEDFEYFSTYDIDRTDVALVRVVEELGDKANGGHAALKIRELPAGTKYRIDEYDGYESVMTIDEYDWKVA